MAYRVEKTDHAGAKNGGGHWGTRAEAKKHSARQRRQAEQRLMAQGYLELREEMLCLATSSLALACEGLQEQLPDPDWPDYTY
jgi:hypothetical protein